MAGNKKGKSNTGSTKSTPLTCSSGQSSGRASASSTATGSSSLKKRKCGASVALSEDEMEAFTAFQQQRKAQAGKKTQKENKAAAQRKKDEATKRMKSNP